MHCFLYISFEPPELVVFPSVLEIEPKLYESPKYTINNGKREPLAEGSQRLH